jgi:hypothetical protein
MIGYLPALLSKFNARPDMGLLTAMHETSKDNPFAVSAFSFINPQSSIING